ncbi:CNH domain-containing protein [Sporodiniella umbellata]|nr:CNH domain-containing protein [Sporodiniella umbellata]
MNLQRTDSNSSEFFQKSIHGSQFLQQATSKFGLKRSFTTKATSPHNRSSPQPRISNSTSMPRVQQDNNHLAYHMPGKNRQKLSKANIKHSQPEYYRAFLSHVAAELKRRIVLSKRIKNDIEYNNVFDGKEAVDRLKEILCTTDTVLALRIGRTLESQRFFHDVNYENRLVDSIIEIYQFNSDLMFHGYHRNDSSGTSISSLSPTQGSEDEYFEDEEDDQASCTTAVSQQGFSFLPNGVYTELTSCYSPTCKPLIPCYSYTCPNKERLRNRPHSVDTREKRITAYTHEIEKNQPLWSNYIDDYVLFSISALERRRQETIFELIYTEESFLSDLKYVVEMWIEPLKNSDVIPAKRRDIFIDQVFSNIHEIYDISSRLTEALKSRQIQHPIVLQVSDIMALFVDQFEPFVYYGARQHQAKHVYELEKYNNPRFALFAEQTERHEASRKLELNGYLTKPTTRLGRYTLLLDKIYDRTEDGHPDKQNILPIIATIKNYLQKVNNETGKAKNRFDLQQIHAHLTFKNKRDKIDLKLLDKSRLIIKQGTLRRTASLDSTEYQVILFDHYLITAKVKVINAVEHYSIRNRPIPIELLGVSLPSVDKNTVQRSSSALLTTAAERLTTGRYSNGTNGLSQSRHPKTNSNDALLSNNLVKLGSPITFFHEGRMTEDSYTIFAPSEHNRNTWNDTITKQKEAKLKGHHVFQINKAVKDYEFFADMSIHHMVVFDQGQRYLLATESGLYMGQRKNAANMVPRKILPLERVQQVQVLETYGLLLVLADNILWQYPLDIIVNGRPDSPQIQHFGRKVQANVNFFHVGDCLGQTLICVPKPSTVNGTEIEIYEPSMPKTEMKKKSLLSKLSIRSSLSFTNTQVNPLKPIYSPTEVWAIDTTKSMILLTTPMGMVAVNMTTKKPDRLLDPSDKHLEFITKNETSNAQLTINPNVKRIFMFQVPNGNYLMCYDRYAFYIDKKGRRAEKNFKIEWEGNPTAFAYHHPYIVAFEHQFIEVRNVEDGHLQQVILGKDICCIQNGQKQKEPLIIGTMVDPKNPTYKMIFELEPVINNG